MEVRARRRREAFLQRKRERESGMSRWAEGAAASSPPFPHPSDMTPGCSERASWAMSQAGFWREEPRERGPSRWHGFLVVLFVFFAVSFCLFWLRLKSGRTRRELSWNWRFSALIYEDALAAVVLCGSANPKLCRSRLHEFRGTEMLEVDEPC